MNDIHRHLILLKDNIRMAAYEKAIKEAVRPGDIVIDLGSGTGVLSLLALKAGAKHVHAVEIVPETLAYSKLVAEENKLHKKITFHKSHSALLKLKDQADVIVSEIFGSLGFNENILPTIIDARMRLLKKSGKIIPEKVRGFIVPVQHQMWIDSVDFLNKKTGFKLLPNSPEVEIEITSEFINKNEFLAKEEIFADVNLYKEYQTSINTSCHFKILKSGVLSGFAGWFETELSGNIGFSTNPNKPDTHWHQAYLPLRCPEKVKAGQQLKLDLEIAPNAGRTSLFSNVCYNYSIK